MAAVGKWSRYRVVAGLVTSSSPVPLRTRHVVTDPWGSIYTTLGITGLEHRTPDRKAWVQCPMPPNTHRVHTEYVLVKSVGPKVSWAELRVLRTG
ncbi:hypothetical protein TNCV_3050661 [Trichonephila clavipes]|nr:hypothetical protein TNCV_3050661 [Trichonephila clavipes]